MTYKKLCPKCGVEKNENDFYWRKYRVSRSSLCKSCLNNKNRGYYARRYDDPEFRKREIERIRKHRKSLGLKEICSIIKQHHEEMKDDPEHLTTEFIKKVVRVDCDD